MTTGTAIPETPDQLEEAFNDNARMENLFAEGNFGEFSRRYIKAYISKNVEDVKAFKNQMQADLQKFMVDQRDRNGAAAPEGWTPGAAPAKGRSARRARAAARSRLRNAETGHRITAGEAAEFFDRQGLFSATAPGADESIDNDAYSDNLRSFVWATLKGEAVAKRDGNSELLDQLQAMKGNLAKTLQVRNAGMAERVPSEGGFLVPETLRSDIMALSLEDSVVRPDATIVPMDSLWVTLPAIDDTSHSSSVFGGVSAAWTAEGASLAGNVSAPKFGRLRLIASKLTAWTQIPNELLQDSVSPMDVWFSTFFPMAMSFFEDAAFLSGSGSDEPEGILNCPGAVVVDATTNYEVTLADVINMYVQLWPPSLKRARWIASPDAFGQLLKMGLIVAGTAIAPPSMLAGYQALEAPAGSAGDGFNWRMMGLPLRISEKVPYPGSGQPDGALTLYDPTGYLIGDRQAMQVASSAEFSFDKDEVSYRITQRVDGRGWQRTPLQPMNGSSNKLSMIVKLGQTTSG